MAKVVVERPRVGGGRSKPRSDWRGYRQRQNEDESPRREKIAQKWAPYEKEFSDFLSPLYGFLEKNVGRPWNQVWSDLCHGLDRGSVTQRHVLEHVRGFVELHAYEHDDGRVTDVFERDLSRSGHRSPLYVSASTGLLTRAPRRPRSCYPSPYSSGARKIRLVWFHRIDGIWYRVWFRLLPPLKTVWICGGVEFGTATAAQAHWYARDLEGVPRWDNNVHSRERRVGHAEDVLCDSVSRSETGSPWFSAEDRETRHWTDGGCVFAAKRLQLDSKTIRQHKLREREQIWGGPRVTAREIKRGTLSRAS